MIKEYRPSSGSVHLDADTIRRIKDDARRQEARGRRAPRPAPAPADDDEVPLPKAAAVPAMAIVRAARSLNWGRR